MLNYLTKGKKRVTLHLILKLKYTFLFVFNRLDRPPPPSCSCPPPLTGGMRDNSSASRNTTCCSYQPPDERPHDLRLALKTPKKEKEKKNLKSLFPPSFVPQLRVCVRGREGRVCALRTNEHKFRAPSAGGRHSGLVTEVWRWRWRRRC